jgi:S-formylglutathione hydrolase FrmB
MYRIHSLSIDSALLRGNRPGDPHRRQLVVLAPEESAPADPLPAVWMLPGHGSSQGSFLADDPWKEGLPARLSRLASAGALKAARFVLPDLFTRFGGCQSLDSAATGPYERHLWEELRPALEEAFRTTAHGIAGHSSGGYGALVQGMRHPEIVRAVACHAGDMQFEYAYLPDFPKAAARYRAEGGTAGFLAAFTAAAKKGDSKWFAGINTLAMAACYSPDEAAPLGVALPFDPETAELHPDTWARWLAWDPVRLVDAPAPRAALGSLALLFVDAGARDEFHLHWGARALARKLRGHQIAHIHEEFDDGHGGTAYRFDRSLPLLVDALSR